MPSGEDPWVLPLPGHLGTVLRLRKFLPERYQLSNPAAPLIDDVSRQETWQNPSLVLNGNRHERKRLQYVEIENSLMILAQPKAGMM